MSVAKLIADLITIARALYLFGLPWLGLTQGAAGLRAVVWLMIADWTGDCLDGPIARRGAADHRDWIGDHDLQADMMVGAGLLFYLALGGFVGPWLTGLYLLAWALIFWRWGVTKSLGMLFQAPIYGWFMWVALRDAPGHGVWATIWIAAAIAITWPKFPNEVVPGFLSGMRRVWGRDQRADHQGGGRGI